MLQKEDADALHQDSGQRDGTRFEGARLLDERDQRASKEVGAELGREDAIDDELLGLGELFDEARLPDHCMLEVLGAHAVRPRG